MSRSNLPDLSGVDAAPIDIPAPAAAVSTRAFSLPAMIANLLYVDCVDAAPVNVTAPRVSISMPTPLAVSTQGAADAMPRVVPPVPLKRRIGASAPTHDRGGVEREPKRKRTEDSKELFETITEIEKRAIKDFISINYDYKKLKNHRFSSEMIFQKFMKWLTNRRTPCGRTDEIKIKFMIKCLIDKIEEQAETYDSSNFFLSEARKLKAEVQSYWEKYWEVKQITESIQTKPMEEFVNKKLSYIRKKYTNMPRDVIWKNRNDIYMELRKFSRSLASDADTKTLENMINFMVNFLKIRANILIESGKKHKDLYKKIAEEVILIERELASYHERNRETCPPTFKEKSFVDASERVPTQARNSKGLSKKRVNKEEEKIINFIKRLENGYHQRQKADKPCSYLIFLDLIDWLHNNDRSCKYTDEFKIQCMIKLLIERIETYDVESQKVVLSEVKKLDANLRSYWNKHWQKPESSVPAPSEEFIGAATAEPASSPATSLASSTTPETTPADLSSARVPEEPSPAFRPWDPAFFHQSILGEQRVEGSALLPPLHADEFDWAPASLPSASEEPLNRERTTTSLDAKLGLEDSGPVTYDYDRVELENRAAAALPSSNDALTEVRVGIGSPLSFAFHQLPLTPPLPSEEVGLDIMPVLPDAVAPRNKP